MAAVQDSRDGIHGSGTLEASGPVESPTSTRTTQEGQRDTLKATQPLGSALLQPGGSPKATGKPREEGSRGKAGISGEDEIDVTPKTKETVAQAVELHDLRAG